MNDLIKSISPNEWIQLAILAVSLLALVISILAFRRAGKNIHSKQFKKRSAKNKDVVKPILERYTSIDVSLMITAKRDVRNQLRLVLKNTGTVLAKDIDLIIGEPIRVINEEELSNGIRDSIEIKDSALKPRLTVLDAKTLFPISTVLPGVVVDILAITTMGYGKICDFPISISWIDDRGTRHFQDELVTI
ncbi:MAG: hypothetical protein ACC657_09790 [Thiohalomonadales bacterium]